MDGGHVKLPFLYRKHTFVINDGIVKNSVLDVVKEILAARAGIIKVSSTYVYGLEELPLHAEYTDLVWFSVDNVQRLVRRIGEDIVGDRIRRIVEEMRRGYYKLLDESDDIAVSIVSDTGWEVTMNGYLPYKARLRVSKSGRHVNITGNIALGGKPEYVLVSLERTRAVDDIEVDINGDAQYIGFDKKYTYILAKAGTSLTVEYWQGNYLEVLEVNTGPPVSVQTKPL